MTTTGLDLKNEVLATYEAKAESQISGKGRAAREIIEGIWDAAADAQIENILTRSTSLNEYLAMQVVVQIVRRHPEANAKLQALKG